MPLLELLRRMKARRQEEVSSPRATGNDAVVPLADYEAAQAALIETRQRLAVAEHRLAVVEGSNRTAARALSRFRREQAHHVDTCAGLVAAREAAEAHLTMAVGDRQRTIVLNDDLLAELRGSEAIRERLENENRRLRGPMPSRPSAGDLTDTAGTTSGPVWPD